MNRTSSGTPSPYLRYQFEWLYAYNVQHGMDVRILDITATPAAAGLMPLGDYWVIEHEHVVLCRYEDGVPRSKIRVEASGAQGYIAAAEIAWQLGTPFTDWWAAHPEYHRVE